jgi:glyoxylate/hydroxypyruvate reductase A
MDVLLCGELDADELHAWRGALGALLPEVRWLDPAQARAAAAGVQAAVVANPPRGSLLGLPGLRLIQSLWAGVDRLLEDPTLPAGVPIARMVDPAMNAAMAETALWAVLALQRDFFDYARQQRAVRWRQLPQRRAEAWHVLVLGLGQMGRAVTRALAQRGYRVSGWRSGGAASDEAPAGVAGHAAFDALWRLLPQAQVVINLLPLTGATRGLLDARFFAALPSGASVVNLARGAHLVEADLLAALGAGQLRHAVLDVFGEEPLPPQHPFWQHPQVTVLPHVAAQTDVGSAAAMVARNLRALRDGRPIEHLVQRERGY